MRRYDGNTGRYIHIPDEGRAAAQMQQPKAMSEEVYRTQPPTRPQKAMPPPNQFGSGLQNILSDIFARGFEVEDLLLFAVLFLMYQETKDKELLIIMGGMFLL